MSENHENENKNSVFNDLALEEPRINKENASSENENLPPDSGEPENGGGSDDGFAGWFQKNNPLYLLSVLFMLLGLHLVSSDVQNSNLSIHGLLAFFAVQNIYEIFMVTMALYLLKNKIQAGHGKILLLFVLLFLGDVTFYQVRISGMSVYYGNIATVIYMMLAAIKLAAVIKILNLTIYHWRIFYVAGSFTLIWVGPKVVYNIIDSVGKAAGSYFDATTIVYVIWLSAGLVHLPLIIQHWRRNSLSEEVKHDLVGNETTFWRYLMIFPMVMMPLQLMLNVMTDSSLTLSRTTPPAAMVLPWVILAGFFVQTMWKQGVEETVGINNFDSGLLGLGLILVLATSQAAEIPLTINFVLVTSGLLLTFVSRGNMLNGLALGIIAMYFSGKQLMEVAKEAVDYGSGLSKTAWAAILMVGSFIMLGLGFMVSIHKNKR